jgi:hypothetical protein
MTSISWINFVSLTITTLVTLMLAVVIVKLWRVSRAFGGKLM